MKYDITIENLKCSGCASTIKKELSKVDGVDQVDVDVDNNIVSVDASSATQEEVAKVLTKLGYPALGDKNTLVHKAKSYVSCAVGRMGKE